MEKQKPLAPLSKHMIEEKLEKRGPLTVDDFEWMKKAASSPRTQYTKVNPPISYDKKRLEREYSNRRQKWFNIREKAKWEINNLVNFMEIAPEDQICQVFSVNQQGNDDLRNFLKLLLRYDAGPKSEERRIRILKLSDHIIYQYIGERKNAIALTGETGSALIEQEESHPYMPVPALKAVLYAADRHAHKREVKCPGCGKKLAL
ncbi:MAG: hypothetical protein ABSA75_15315 [Candidatus Bathyarchaeia archaeon]